MGWPDLDRSLKLSKVGTGLPWPKNGTYNGGGCVTTLWPAGRKLFQPSQAFWQWPQRSRDRTGFGADRLAVTLCALFDTADP